MEYYVIIETVILLKTNEYKNVFKHAVDEFNINDCIEFAMNLSDYLMTGEQGDYTKFLPIMLLVSF